MWSSLPWAEVAILVPLLAGVWCRWLRDPDAARRQSLGACGLALLASCLALVGYLSGSQAGASPAEPLLRNPLISLDGLSAPLLPLVALLYLLTALATLGAKVRRFSFSSMLVGESILLATLSCQEPWAVIGLLVAGAVPPLVELRISRRPARVYTLYMALFAVLLVGGQIFLTIGGDERRQTVGLAMLAAATLVRGGVVPLHSWVPELFERATFGTALLFATPMVSIYAVLRLVFPWATDSLLSVLAALSLFTAVYGAGMALVQSDARRLFAYLFLSHSSLVLFGVTMGTPIGMTAALCGWFAVSLSMAGFGLTLRAIEARTGRLLLNGFHGLVSYTPRLAGLFLITGLASIGFPGTIGFVGAELLVDGAAQSFPLAGIVIVLAAALNGLAVLYVYFRVFAGVRYEVSIDLRSRPSERIAVLVLSALILGGGLYPQPGVESRYRVATELVSKRSQSAAKPVVATTTEITPRRVASAAPGNTLGPAVDSTSAGTPAARFSPLLDE